VTVEDDFTACKIIYQRGQSKKHSKNRANECKRFFYLLALHRRQV